MLNSKTKNIRNNAHFAHFFSTENIKKVVRMAATAASSLQFATIRPNISSKVVKAGTYIVGANPRNASSWDKLAFTRHLSKLGCLRNNSSLPTSKKSFSFSTKAMSESSENKASSGLPIDLRGWLYLPLPRLLLEGRELFELNQLCSMVTGKRAFIAGIADDNGYGWAIAKSLAAAGAEILVGTWVPVSFLFFKLY